MNSDMNPSEAIFKWLLDVILGPTGGLMAICLIIGVYIGWRLSEKVLVDRYIKEVQKLEAKMLANESICREEISRLTDRMRTLEDSRVAILSSQNIKNQSSSGFSST